MKFHWTRKFLNLQRCRKKQPVAGGVNQSRQLRKNEMPIKNTLELTVPYSKTRL